MLHEVQLLEVKHEVKEQWTPDTEMWVQAGELAAMEHFQSAVDHLEGLVVAWLFELTKMNMSRTGE